MVFERVSPRLTFRDVALVSLGAVGYICVGFIICCAFDIQAIVHAFISAPSCGDTADLNRGSLPAEFGVSGAGTRWVGFGTKRAREGW